MNNIDKSVPKAEEFKDLDFATNDPLLTKIVDAESEEFFY